MSDQTSGHRGGRLTAVGSGALALVAVVLIGLALRGQQHLSAPAPSAARTSAEGNLPASSGPESSPPATPRTARSPRSTASAVVGPVLPRSTPVALELPSIHLATARLVQYGQDRSGSISVPPAAAGTPAGWYTGSPTPGQVGPSVIVGHVDSAGAGPSVFFHLGQLQPGDLALVTLADRTVAEFRVDSVETYSKADFPTLGVYGNINHSGLRLITCGGPFNPAKGHYEDNIVVYAHLVGSRSA